MKQKKLLEYFFKFNFVHNLKHNDLLKDFGFIHFFGLRVTLSR